MPCLDRHRADAPSDDEIRGIRPLVADILYPQDRASLLGREFRSSVETSSYALWLTTHFAVSAG